MTGPCLCGDPYCRSCGPAQGNARCDICGKWSMDGGCDDPDGCADSQQRYDAEIARHELAEERWGEEHP